MAVLLSNSQGEFIKNIMPKLEKDYKQQYSNFLSNAFTAHYALWNSYEDDVEGRSLSFCDESSQNAYPIQLREDYCFAILPSYFLPSENNCWTTHRVNNKDYGAYQMKAAIARGHVTRYTWVIGKLANGGNYIKGYISTTHENKDNGLLLYANIQSFYYGGNIDLYNYAYRGDPIFLSPSTFPRDMKKVYITF